MTDQDPERDHVDAKARMLTSLMHRSCSECALQTAIELMLTDHSTEEVIDWLDTWAEYLEDRR